MWSGKQVITHDRECAVIQKSCFESLVSYASIILSMLLMSLFWRKWRPRTARV